MIIFFGKIARVFWGHARAKGVRGFFFKKKCNARVNKVISLEVPFFLHFFALFCIIFYAFLCIAFLRGQVAFSPLPCATTRRKEALPEKHQCFVKRLKK